MTFRERLDASPMSRAQWAVVAVCTFLNALDGFDVLAMAFTANQVSTEFGLGGAELGLLLSAGLVGMAVGSLFLAPYADTIGRRRMLLLSTGLAAAGMFASATAPDALALAGWRMLTGLGVGGVLACTNVLASEYANRRWRGMAISIYTAGYGIGATLGGSAAVWLQAESGWRSVFVFGGACTAAAFALAALAVPESADFLITRRPPRALERLNAIARRTGHPAFDALPAAAAPGSARGRLAPLFDGARRRTTLLVWTAFFATMFGFYFVNSWTPKLLVTAGMTESQGVVGGLMLTLGGTFGSLLFGALTTRWDARRVLVCFSVVSAGAMVLFITSAGLLAVAFAAGVAVGMLVNGCIAGLYTLAPASYPVASRGTGVGWAIGVGRVGAILAPIATGALLDAGWSAAALYAGVGAVMLGAAWAVARLRPAPAAAPEAAPART